MVQLHGISEVRPMHRYITYFLLVIGSLLLSSCGSSASSSIAIALTDSPADGAQNVVVEFVAIQFQPDIGPIVTIDFTSPTQIDLAKLQNGANEPILQSGMPAGHYQWLQFLVSATSGAMDSYIVLADGSQHSLVLTASGQTGLRVNGGFTLSPGVGSTFVIDFDARKSVLNPQPSSSDYQLQPVLRMLDYTQAGNIIGTVQGAFITTGCMPVIYTYAGVVVNPSDLNNTAPAATQPVTESPVTLNDASGAYQFTAAFLPPGTYTLAFTCDAGNDDPAAADSLIFNPVGTTQANAGQTTLVGLN
jgi:hypothetical protein